MDEITIVVDRKIKDKLDNIKKHPRESYNEVVLRLLSYRSNAEIDSLNESIEIMSDSKIMASLARSVDDLNKGRLFAFKG